MCKKEKSEGNFFHKIVKIVIMSKFKTIPQNNAFIFERFRSPGMSLRRKQTKCSFTEMKQTKQLNENASNWLRTSRITDGCYGQNVTRRANSSDYHSFVPTYEMD